MARDVDPAVIADIVAGTHHDPHAILGPHVYDDGVVVRVLRPLASEVAIETLDGTFPAVHVSGGLWQAAIPGTEAPDYRVHVTYDADPVVTDDPYRFLPLLGELDLHLIREGARAPVGEPRRARAQLPVRAEPPWRRVLRLGAQRALRARHRRLQPLAGRRARDALARGQACGSCSSQALETAPTTSSRSWARTATGVQQADPMARRTEVPLTPRRSSRRAPTDGETTGGSPRARPRQPTTAPCPSTRSTWARGARASAIAILPTSSFPTCATWASRTSGAHARHGAPVRRLVGISGDVVLRAHRALRHL